MDLIDKLAFTELINRYNLERGSDTPDNVLANYLYDCLEAYNMAVFERNRLTDQL